MQIQRLVFAGIALVGLALLFAGVFAVLPQAAFVDTWLPIVALSIPLVPLVGLLVLVVRLNRRQEVALSAIAERLRQALPGHSTSPGAEPVSALADEVNALLEAFDDRELELERQARAFQQDLQNQVAPLKSQLQEAKAASRASREFLAAMSHEIRTPMNGVLGMTQLLIDSGLDLRQQRLAETAHRSAQNLLSVIDDILDFSRIEAGKLELVEQPFSLRKLLEDLLDLFAGNAQAKGVALLGEMPPGLPDGVIGDPPRLRQVLVNLLANAIKFTDQGNVSLLVEMREVNADRARLVFRVSDTGPGIDASRQEAIFEAFCQGGPEVSGLRGGTGLGLAISSRLASLMGGRLSVESEAGKGATFQLDVPLKLDTSHAPGLIDVSALGGVRLLAVGIQDDQRGFLRSRADAWGLRELEVEDGEQALLALAVAAAESDPFKFLLLNRRLPDMDALDLLEKLRADPLVPALKTVLLGVSERDVAVSRELLDDFGITCALPTPLLQARLFDCLLAKPEAALSAASGEGDGKASVPAAGGRVLLVEDNAINQEVACDMLASLGYEVVTGVDGREGLRLAEAQSFDAVLMDCHMPVMDGFEATRGIREMEQRSGRERMPIIALTADVRKGVEEKCRDAGMDDYLGKPFSKEALSAKLSHWLPGEDEVSLCDLRELGSAQGERLLDPEIVERVRELGARRSENTFERLLNMLMQQGREGLAHMRGGLAGGEVTPLVERAHALKSASANLGAVRLSDCFARIESLARDRQMEGMDGLIDEAERLLELSVTALGKSQPPPQGAHPVASRGEGGLILLVDDDESFCLFASESLRQSGFTVEAVQGGAAALRRLESAPHPDLVLLDAVMPGMDGFAVCERLKKQPAVADVPVVMVTGLHDETSINRAFDAGASGFTLKPVNMPILLQQIRFTLRAARTEQALREQTSKLTAAQRIARLGSWRWMVDGGVFAISDQLARMCNIQPREFTGTLEAFLELVREEDRGRVRKSIQGALVNGVGNVTEYHLGTEGDSVVVSQQVEIRTTSDGAKMLHATVQDISRQRAAEEKIRKLAYYDVLTGLASRSHLHQRLHDSIKAASRRGEQFALLFLDLDRFKTINDSLGHEAGDELLTTVAQRLRRVLRETDFAARLGGDEFCLLIEQVSDEYDAADAAERCLEQLAQETLVKQQLVRPHASVGIALYPRDGSDPGALLKAADSAMYAAKRAGKHRYAFYTAQMTRQAEQRLVLESELRQALERREFEIYFQPQVEIKSGNLAGVEALVRWHHPSRGLLMPESFIGVVERIGLVHELGAWVMRKACEIAVEWHATVPDLKLAVNVSPLQFEDQGFIAIVRQVIQETAIDPHRLDLEVTESAVQAQGDSLATFRELKEMGVGIVIDDFGTGYSALGSLKHLPVDKLKVDELFLRDILDNHKDAVMLGTIIGLAHTMGYKVIAEGAETLEQVQVLAGFRCDQVQGFGIAYPMPAEDLQRLFNRSFRAGQGFIDACKDGAGEASGAGG